MKTSWPIRRTFQCLCLSMTILNAFEKATVNYTLKIYYAKRQIFQQNLILIKLSFNVLSKQCKHIKRQDVENTSKRCWGKHQTFKDVNTQQKSVK